MAALLTADGTSVFEENIFDCRYRHVDAFIKMGADIQVLGKVAVIKGVPSLYGASVEATPTFVAERQWLLRLLQQTEKLKFLKSPT